MLRALSRAERAGCGGWLLVALACAASSAYAGDGVRRFALPERPPVDLQLVAKLQPGPARENSGIVKSRRRDDLFWMQNDSGDEPRIYPIHRDGRNYDDERYSDEHGVLVGGAINVDWEDIAVTAAGELIVADLGNNDNDRRDLVLYCIDEPAPTAGRTTFRRKLFVRYPDQHEFPPPRDQFNFDCEAVFTVENTLHFLSKNRGNRHATLYRLDDPTTESVNVLTKLGTVDVAGQAVGADCTADGRRLAVLTYASVWLFVRGGVDEDFFAGEVFWAPLERRDAEAICFADDATLLIADEASAELFELPIAKLERVAPQ